MHFHSGSYCSILGAKGAAFHAKSCTHSPALLQAQQLQIRALGLSHFSSGYHEHSHSQFVSYSSLSLLPSFEETH